MKSRYVALVPLSQVSTCAMDIAPAVRAGPSLATIVRPDVITALVATGAMIGRARHRSMRRGGPIHVTSDRFSGPPGGRTMSRRGWPPPEGCPASCGRRASGADEKAVGERVTFPDGRSRHETR